MLKRLNLVPFGSGCIIFLLIIFFFGKQILGLHGPEFEAGYPALCFISLETSAWTMFSLAPAYLNFTGRNLFVIVTTVVEAIIMAVLTAILGLFYGSTGAGIAICIVLCGIAGIFLMTANSDFLRRKKSHEDKLTENQANPQ